MSQSPREELRLQRYLDGWEIINRMIREDTSWGGRERSCFHLSCGPDRFIDISAASGLDYLQDGRALCRLDLDRDGRPDLALRNRDGPQLRLLKNTWPESSRALWVRLEGRSCNRDAIGARISITTAGRTRLKEVRAGAAFLSQSSRWTCFGLGETREAPAVSVRWPGGKTTDYGNLEPTARWLIIEGEKPARLPFQPSPPETPAARAEKMSPPAPGEKDTSIETWLVSPMPAPDLPWKDLAGRERRLGEFSGKPLLLHLFSRDCAVCVAGLAKLAEAGTEISAKGAGSLIASVDLGPVPDGKRNLLAKIREPSIALRFEEKTLAGWNILFRHLFNHRRDLVVPTSFLLDENGRVVKVYRGKTDPARYIEDLGRIPRNDAMRIQRALPFPGRYLYPGFQRDLLELGNAYSEEGLPLQARAIFKTTIESQAGNIDSLFNYAISSAQAGQEAEARKIYLEILKKRPDFDDARNNLGILDARAGRFDSARKYFESVLRNNPAHTEAALNLANTWLQEESFETAVEIYREALEHDVESATLRRMLGFALFRKGDVDGSIGAHEDAIRLDPLDLDAYRNLAIILNTSGDYRQAATISARGLEKNDGHAGLLNTHGMALWALGEKTKAEGELKKSVAADPGFDRPYLNLAGLLKELGRPGEAAGVLSALLEAIPGHRQAAGMLRELQPERP